MQEPGHIKYLYQKYLENDISDLGREKLMRFFDSATDQEIDQVIGELSDIEIDQLEIPHLNRRTDRIFSRIRKSTQPKQSSLWSWLPYAAAVISLIAVLVFLYSRQTGNPEPPRTVQVIKDLAPGGKRATLTLSGGKTIILDSAGVGQLALIDGTRISKTIDGQLIYEVNAEGKGNPQTNTVNIPRGGEYQLFLPDGTKVWLNSATSITYPIRFTGNQRKIRINGEAYLEVAKDAAHPFVVETRTQTIQVLGTHFNINTYQNDRTVTTLEEGSVLVSSLRGSKQSVLLKPGQQSVNTNTLTVEAADLESALAWKNGLMVFKHTPLKTVLAEISRWYDVDVVYNGTPPTKTLSGGISRSWNLSATLRILTLTGVKTRLISDGNSRKLIIEP